MEIYINVEEENPDIVLAELKKIKAKACIQSSPYAYVKSGFCKKYPDYMGNDEAQEETANEEKDLVWDEQTTLLKKQPPKKRKEVPHNEKRI